MATRNIVSAWWRDPVDYRWLVGTFESRGALRALKMVVAIAGLAMAVTAVLNWRYTTGVLSVVLIVDIVAGVLWAVRWSVAPWPGEWTSLVLVAIADLLITCGCLADSGGFFSIVSLSWLIVTGGYLTVFHGPRILVLHAGWSVLVVLTMSWFRLFGQDDNLVRASMVLTMGGLMAGLMPTLQFCSWVLRIHALSDPLTDLLNRRGLDYYVSRWFGPHDREPISVMTIDVDRFKAVNDTLGHAEGDRVLLRIADCLRAESPPGAVVVRSGGEEFVVAAHLSGDAAAGEAERLRHAIEAAVGPVTASIGVGVAERRSPGRDLTALLLSSDSAMYRAKQSGGNTVSVNI
ncbi:diguanylate cyclase [Nocardia sp. BMG111209]|uniref:GGDEF domain-containing protein n=1 Tax=Nocardia sp. BMG111209 TaxID=1160137 RepID=UPI000365E992|nr:GGDEF domain-containing protein [Nocardia sp. BMG111209]